MEYIIQPNNNFDFSKLSLANPIGIQGGSYFTKILYNEKPLYVQTTKSLTRQGFVKSGKKYYCDLMFDNNSAELINWFENLEETCHKLIFEKNDTWFQSSLDKNDLENAFNSVIRIYKSGKYYLVRTNIKINNNNEPNIKIYNENELSMTINDVTNETYIISILEIQGIKFTSRNFQIDIELKQIMLLDNEIIFDNCLIKKNNSSEKNILTQNTLEDNLLLMDSHIHNEYYSQNDYEVDELNSTNNDIIHNETINNETINNETINNETINNDIKNNNINLEIEDLNDSFDGLKEINIPTNIVNNLETITLKQPNQVYYELYKEARNKAKEAKKNAIIAYLEAKNIKKTYMLDILDESDIDAEIDEVSDSELDTL